MDTAFFDLSEDLPIIEEDDSGFYEHIQAPKFVDFTAPESPPIDDRSWFCRRFGCDRQHEEFELDPEALRRDFMLRVMAARSPNVKFQRSLNKHCQSPGSLKKCPHSAPAKPVKGRTGGTNYISSIPSYSSSNLKTHPVSSLRSTPSTKEENTKTLISEKKSFMSPRPKGLPAKHVSSKSANIGNEKVESLNHKDTAKASHRSSSISKTGDICDGMKKLSIGNGKVGSLNYKDAAKALRRSSGMSKNSDIRDGTKMLGIDSIKQNKKTVKKNCETVSTPEDACKAISEVGVNSRSTMAKALLISNSTSKYDDICDGMKKLGIDSIKQNKKTVKKNCEAVSTPEDACKAISEVGVNSRSAMAKALLISNSTSKYDDICDGMKKLSIDSMKKNKKRSSVKKKAEAVSVDGKTLSEVGVEHEIVDDIVPTISMESNQSYVSEEILKVTEVVPQISTLDNSAEFDDDKENACATRCRKISTAKSESSEDSQQKENKAPIKQITEAILKGKVKRSTNPKPFRLRTDERRIVKDANTEKKMQVKSQKENLTITRHGDIKNVPKPFRLRTDERRIVKDANTERKMQVKSQKENLTTTRQGDIKNKYAIDERNTPVTLAKDDKSKYVISGKTNRTTLEGPKDDNIKYANNGKKHRRILEGPKYGNSKYVINGKNHRRILEGPKDDNSKHVSNGKSHRSNLEGSKVDNSKYVVNGKNHRRNLQGTKDSKHEIVKEADTKSNIQLKTQKKIPTLKFNGDLKNQNAIQGKNPKTTLEVPKAKPKPPKAPRVRYVESRFGKSSPSIHKLQPKTKETEVIQNKVIKTGSSIPNAQRVPNARTKTLISQAAVERNCTIANAACLKGKRQSVTNKETKFANCGVKG